MYYARCTSLRGKNHYEQNIVCQDASGKVIGDDYVITAVADGHGSKMRSDVGSKIAINVSLSVIEEYVLRRDTTMRLKEAKDNTMREIKSRIYERWLYEIHDYDLSHFDKDYDSEGDSRRCYAKVSDYLRTTVKGMFDRYGTTLLISAVTADYILTLQIGDGGCAYVYKDKHVELLNNLLDIKCDDAYSTSLLDEHADLEMHYDLRFADSKEVPISTVIFTDGFEIYNDEESIKEEIRHITVESFSEENWFKFATIRMNRMCRYKGDDISVAVAFRKNVDPIDLYCDWYDSEYPYEISDSMNNTYEKYIVWGGYIDDRGVEENRCVFNRMTGELKCGKYSNGAIQESQDLDIFITDPWNHYSNLCNKWMKVPDESEYITKTLIGLVCEIKNTHNITDSEKIIDIFKRALFSIIEKIRKCRDEEFGKNRWYDLIVRELPTDVEKQITDVSSCFDVQFSKIKILHEQQNKIWKEERSNDDENKTLWCKLFEGKLNDDSTPSEGKLFLIKDATGECTSYFEGSFKNEKINSGRKVIDGNIVYEGHFSNGEYSGNGNEYCYENGEIKTEYVGDFVKGRRSGKGEEHKVEYDEHKNLVRGLQIFEGYYEDGMYKSGTKYDQSGLEEYKGIFKSGKIWNSDDKVIVAGLEKNGILWHSRGEENGYLWTLKYQGSEDNNLPSGKEVTEYCEGKIISRGEFKKGELYEGKRYFYSNGVICMRDCIKNKAMKNQELWIGPDNSLKINKSIEDIDTSIEENENWLKLGHSPNTNGDKYDFTVDDKNWDKLKNSENCKKNCGDIGKEEDKYKINEKKYEIKADNDDVLWNYLNNLHEIEINCENLPSNH